MNNIILYASKKGSTKKCAEFLHQENPNSDLFTYDQFSGDINKYDQIVLCTPVYVGQIHKSMKYFIELNKDILLSKETYIVINAMNRKEYDEMLKRNFNDDWLNHGKIVYGGGAYSFEKMNFLERFIVRKITGIKKDVEDIRYEELKKIRL